MIERLPLQGSHVFMSPEEVATWQEKLRNEHDTYLNAYHVKLPKAGSANALWLAYLRKHQGRLVHKDTISAFVNSVNPKSGKDQQVRHLARAGWYVLNKGDKIPQQDEKIPSGYHMLVTTENPKPDFLFKALKRAGRIAAKNFDQLKAVYDWRCRTCGSQEGKPHFLEPSQRTQLQQGHMDPHKKLTLDNSIPQCQLCNQTYQDDYAFNDKGRVVAVASPKPVLRACPEIQNEIYQALKDKGFR